MMELELRDDFDLDRIAESGQCFRWERTEDGGCRIPFRQSCLHIRPAGEGRFLLDCSEAEYRAVWHSYFDLDEDYRGIRARVSEAEDPFLSRAVRAQQGIRILRQDPWEVTVSFIISQNRNIPAIHRSIDLLCRAAGRKGWDAEGRRFYAFPEPEAIRAMEPEALDACALGYRGKYVHAAAEAVCAGRLDLDALAAGPERAAMETLLRQYGIGVKVASCIALFGLHQTDAFPVDTWVRRILEREYPQGYPFRRYSPYNGVYQQYMFAYYRALSAAGQLTG